MQTDIIPKKQGLCGYVADLLMMPVMYALQGNFREKPQRTHRWNNIHLKNNAITDLHADHLVIVPGDVAAHRRWLGPIPLFHMPIFGGWKKFVVIEPVDVVDEWFIGWVAFDALGLSKIQITGPVRLGIGPRQAHFFGLAKNGEQLRLKVVGEGEIGVAAEYSTILLL